MTYRVYIDWTFQVIRSCTDDGLVSEVEQIMEQLLALEGNGLQDSAVSLDAVSNLVQIEVTFDADTMDQGITEGMSCIRAAIHAAGGATPDWPELRATDFKAELVDA